MGSIIDTESFIKLRKLTIRDDEPVEDIVRRGAAELSSLKAKAVFELRLVDTRGLGVTSLSAWLTTRGASLLERPVESPTLVAITTPKVFP